MIKPSMIVIALGFLLSPSPASAADPPSVLVQTASAKRGSLPDTVTAYGTATAAIDGSTTLSLPSDGRVLQLTVTPGQTVQLGQRLLDFGGKLGSICNALRVSPYSRPLGPEVAKFIANGFIQKRHKPFTVRHTGRRHVIIPCI